MPTSQFVCAINLVIVRTAHHWHQACLQYATPEIEGGIGPSKLISIQVFKYSHHQCMEELSHENLNTFSCEMEGRWFRGSRARVGPSTRHKLGNIGSAKIFTHEQVGYIGLERLKGTWLELEHINLVPFPNKTRVAE